MIRAAARRMSLLVTLALLAALLVVNLMLDPLEDGLGLGRTSDMSDADAALLESIETGDRAAMRRAIAGGGADVNAIDRCGWSMLTHATSVGDVELCAELLSHGASADGGDDEALPPIVCATLHGDQRMVELLIQHGADVNATTFSGGTALNVAASSGQFDIAAALIRAGADVNAADAHGWTPLMGAASQSDSAPLVEILLVAGARLDMSDNEGNTAIRLAGRGDNLRIVELLLRRRRLESYGRNLLGMGPLDPWTQRNHCRTT